MQNPDRQNSFDELPVITWKMRRMRSGGGEVLDDHLVLEEPLEIVINKKSIAVLMRMPGQEKELAAGFCLTEGYVQKAQDIFLIHHCGQGLPAPGEEEGQESGFSRNRIELSVAPEGFHGPEASDSVRLIRSGCGAADVSAMSDALPFLSEVFLSTPTSLAVQIAQDRGLTLIGYLRGSRMNVYTHAERLREQGFSGSTVRPASA